MFEVYWREAGEFKLSDNGLDSGKTELGCAILLFFFLSIFRLIRSIINETKYNDQKDDSNLQ